jgi:hypothetical protein
MRPNNLGEQFHAQLVETVFRDQSLSYVCTLVGFRLRSVVLEDLLNLAWTMH